MNVLLHNSNRNAMSDIQDALDQLFKECRHANGFITANLTTDPTGIQIIVVNKLFPVAQRFIVDPTYAGFPVVIKEWHDLWP